MNKLCVKLLAKYFSYKIYIRKYPKKENKNLFCILGALYMAGFSLGQNGINKYSLSIGQYAQYLFFSVYLNMFH